MWEKESEGSLRKVGWGREEGCKEIAALGKISRKNSSGLILRYWDEGESMTTTCNPVQAGAAMPVKTGKENPPASAS